MKHSPAVRSLASISDDVGPDLRLLEGLKSLGQLDCLVVGGVGYARISEPEYLERLDLVQPQVPQLSSASRSQKTELVVGLG